MTTGILCRRFSGQSYRTAAFSTTTKAADKRMSSREAEKCRNPPETDRRTKSGVTFRLSYPSEYRVSLNPSAYIGSKCVGPEDATRDLEEGSPESDYTGVGARQVQNTYSITCSRRLSSIKNILLDLEKTKKAVPLIRPSKFHSHPMVDDEQAVAVEAFNTMEDPRVFQKQRPEYEHLCYHRCEPLQPLSAEEGDLILQNVTEFKSSLKPGTIATYFFSLSRLPSERHMSLRSNAKFAMLCRYGVENIQQFDTLELIMVLKAFVGLAVPCTHSMLNVFETECCRRVWNMSLDQQLLVADLWRCMGRSVPRYLEIVLSRVNLHWKNLTLPQLVQLVYVIGEGRRAPEDLMKKLDFLVLKYLDSLNLEEVGTVCLGFFKSHNGLSEHTMRRIGDKVCAHMDEVSNYALVSVLKMYRFTHVDHIDFLKRLGSVVPSRIPSIGTQGVMHIALAFSALHYLDERIMDAVAASVPSRAVYCRSKDIAKFLWSFGCLNYAPPNSEEFFASLERQMRTKMHEFQKFPEHLLTALLALAFAERFPNDLIDYALSPEFVALTKESKFDLQKDLFTLDGTVEHECPHYTGSRLEPHLRKETTEMLWKLAKKEICLKPEVVEAVSLLEDMLGGSQYVKSHMILPHTRSIDLEVHLDPHQKPLPFNTAAVSKVKPEPNENGVSLTDDLMNHLLKGTSSRTLNVCESPVEVDVQECATPPEHSRPTWDHSAFSSGVQLTGKILDALTNSTTPCDVPAHPSEEQHLQVKKMAIQVTNRNQYCYNSKRLLGLHHLKRRQLRKSGYTVIELSFWEWFLLLRRSRSEKLSYLHHKVFGSEV